MDRPSVPEDERLQLHEMVNAALRDGCVVEYFLQARQTFDPPRHVEKAVAIMPSLLIDPVSVLIELRAGPMRTKGAIHILGTGEWVATSNHPHP